MLDPQSGALNIYNAQKEDSSTYLMRVSNATGKEQEWKILLEVLGELGEPKGKSPLQGPWVDPWEASWEARDRSLGGGEKNFRTGLIHFSWS